MKFPILLLTLVTLSFCSAIAGPGIDGKPKQAVVGKVAQVVKAANVYSQPSLRSKVHFGVKPPLGLVVDVNAPKGWGKVWLSNGEYGYIQIGAVSVSPQDYYTPVDQVGDVIKSATVYEAPDVNSGTSFAVAPNQELVVNAIAPEGWLKVKLKPTGYGYIQREAIELKDIEVTPEELMAWGRVDQPLMSRGGLARGSRNSREAAADTGLDFLGTPYRWGGNDIEHGIDCSGFVKTLYGAFGMNLPRTAAEQATVGIPITRLEDLQKGDRLYFWEAKRGKIGHTGLYLGDYKFIHSSSGHHGVAVSDLREGSWLRILFAARR